MQKNVTDGERAASILLGGAALATALWQRPSKIRRATYGVVGIGLLWRGLTGACAIYRRMGINIAGETSQLAKPFTLEKAVIVNRPLAAVTEILASDGIQGITFKPGEAPDEFRSSALDHWTLKVTETKDNRRTQLAARIESGMLDSRLRLVLWNVSRPALDHAVAAELRKIKALIETGEVATIEGQPAGERSAVGALADGFMGTIHKKLEALVALPLPFQSGPVALKAWG